MGRVEFVMTSGFSVPTLRVRGQCPHRAGSEGLVSGQSLLSCWSTWVELVVRVGQDLTFSQDPFSFSYMDIF